MTDFTQPIQRDGKWLIVRNGWVACGPGCEGHPTELDAWDHQIETELPNGRLMSHKNQGRKCAICGAWTEQSIDHWNLCEMLPLCPDHQGANYQKVALMDLVRARSKPR